MYNIAYVAKAGAGKSYCCQYLIKYHGYKLAKMATSVYAIAETYFGMDKNQKDRKLMQVIGTDVGRNQVDNNLWVKRFSEDVLIAQTTYQQLYNKQVNFCSDDVRFKNEFDALVQAGWKMIYLDVPDEIRKARLIKRDGTAQESTLNHISETEIDTFKDQCIQMDASGSIEETYNNLENLLQQFQHSERV